MASARLVAVLTFGALTAATVIAACGTEAVGVDACRQVEYARCDRALGCGIPLTRLGAEGQTAEDCRRFYRDACLHGLATRAEPAAVDVDQCTVIIREGSCDTVVSPQSHPACAWLIPTDAGEPVADGASDGASPFPDAGTPQF